MLYFSLPVYHNHGRSHRCGPGNPFTKEQTFLIKSVLCIFCFPIAVPIFITDRIEKWQNRRRQERSPSTQECRRKLKIRKSKEEAFKKQRSRWNPGQLRKVRKSALTVPSNSEINSSTSSLSTLDEKDIIQREDTQQASPTLLGLPFHVRQQIWERVIGRHSIAIYCGQGRLVHALEEETDTDGEIYGSGESSLKSDRGITHLSALLKICRQV